MNIKDNYSSKLAVISSIPDKDISIPVNIPVHVYIQEAEVLKCWCQADKEKLIAGGLDWSLVEDLPARIDTLRQAQSIWNASTDVISLNKKWKEITTEARELRQLLLHHMRFIFRKDAAALAGIRKLSEGKSHIAIIQALYNIAIFGEERIELLEAAHFDISLLRRAADLSGEMSSLYADVTNTRRTPDKKYKIRNQAYTHLEEAVEEIKSHAKHIFWKNPEKLKHYRSHYRMRKNRKHRKNLAIKEAMLNSGESITAENHPADTAKPCTETLNHETAVQKPVTKILKSETNRSKGEMKSLKRETNRPDTETMSLKTETNRSNIRTKSVIPETNASGKFNNTPKVYPGHHEPCNNIIFH